MATKKKPTTQQKQPLKVNKKNIVVEEVKPITGETYIPSLNAEKYPETPSNSIQYKILAYKNDYVRLQDEVSKYLNDGWQLSGGVSTSMTVSQYESITIFAQAIIKK